MSNVRVYGRISIAGCLVAMAVSAFAQGPMPSHRAGWWETTMSMGPSRTMTTSMCVDAASERAMGGVSHSLGPGCSPGSLTPIPGGWRMASTCTRGGQTHSMTGTITGDFSSHVHMDMISDGGPGGGMHMTADQKYRGACPAGRRPGDVVLPGGMVVNMGGHSPH